MSAVIDEILNWSFYVMVIQMDPLHLLSLTILKPDLGKLSYKKNDEKRGHLLSDYRQKCVNATRDILMTKLQKITIFYFSLPLGDHL